MPEISPADHTILQSGPPVVLYKMAFIPRQVIFACDLDNVSATWGLATLQFDNVTTGFWQDVMVGAWGSVANATGEDLGQTLLVYSSAGVYKGKVRVRAIAASTITVAANNDIEWADDDQLRILDYFEPWSRPTYMTSNGSIVYYKDTDIAWTSNNVSLPPKANGGMAWAGDVNTNIQFDAAPSHPNAPGATISSVVWFIKDGSFVVGGAATTAITVSYANAGFRWILLVVTDSNGQKNVHRLPVWTFGGDYQPFDDFTINRRNADGRDSEVGIEAFGDELTPDNPLSEGTDGIPDNVGMIMFTEMTINGVTQTIDSACPFPGRGHIKLVGWVLGESVRWDAETGEVSFKCITLGKMADDLPGYPTFVKDVAAADAWQTLVAPTIRSAIFWLWHWHSNLDTLAYMEILSVADTDPTPVIAGRNFPKAPPFKQVENAFLENKGIFAHLGVTKWGSVHIRYDPAVQDAAGRAAVVEVMDLTNEDWLEELVIDNDHRPALSSLLGGGIYYDGADGTPYRGRSPGNVGRQSGQTKRADNLIIAGQADLNEKLGLLLAKESSPQKPVPVLTWYDIWEPALQELTTLTVTVAENPRGLAFDTTTQWIVRRVDIKDQTASAPDVRLTIEQLREGFAGVTVAIPDPPAYPDPEPPPELPELEPPPNAGTGEAWVFATRGNGVMRTLDMISGNPPTYTALNGNLTDDSYILWFTGDNTRPSTHLACIDNSPGVHVHTDWRVGGDWTPVLSQAEAIVQLSYLMGVAVYTLNLLQIHAFEGNLYLLVNGDADIDGTSYVRVLRSTNWGSTWALFGGNIIGKFGPWIASPTCDNNLRQVFTIYSKAVAATAGGGTLGFNPVTGQIIFAARCTAGALSRSNRLDYSGGGWVSPYTNYIHGSPCSLHFGGWVGGSDNPPTVGPGGIVVNVSGQWFIGSWYGHEDDPALQNAVWIVTGDASPAAVDTVSGTIGAGPDMMISTPHPSDLFIAFDADLINGETDVYRNSTNVVQSVLPRVCFFGRAYQALVDGAVVMVAGRTPGSGSATAPEPELVYLSVNGGLTWIEKGEPMYADGVIGITGAHSDPLTD